MTIGARSASANEDTPFSAGVGVHYWRAVADIDDDFDKDGLAYALTFQWRPSLLGVGLDVERQPSGFGGAPEEVYEPLAYLILGDEIYAAAGVGGYYTESEFKDKPFYLFRAGLDLNFLSPIHIDIHADYRFENWSDLNTDGKDIDTQTITLGGAAKIVF